MNKMNKKGFTLAELLIVVAIIGVLVAIAIPVFTTQLEKSREATDIANVRSAYAEVVTAYLSNESDPSMTVEAKQTVSGWQGPTGTIEYFSDNATQAYQYSAKYGANASYTVSLTIDASTGNATPKVS